jgi:hypothetical protein
MNVLLDTNVLSEARRPAPDLKVLAWLDSVDEDRVFISTASIAELRRGVALMSRAPDDKPPSRPRPDPLLLGAIGQQLRILGQEVALGDEPAGRRLERRKVALLRRIAFLD